MDTPARHSGPGQGDGGAATAGLRGKRDADYISHELTRSICPECKAVIDAQVIIRDNKVFMRKRCPAHGWFEGIISSDAEMYVDSIKFNKPGTLPLEFSTQVKNGCPLDCGLCPEHKQRLSGFQRAQELAPGDPCTNLQVAIPYFFAAVITPGDARRRLELYDAFPGHSSRICSPRDLGCDKHEARGRARFYAQAAAAGSGKCADEAASVLEMLDEIR